MPWSLMLFRNLECFILRHNDLFVYLFFLFFSYHHWWNCVFNICINSILHWVMSQKYWGLYRWMILLHNLNGPPVSGGLNLIIFPGQCGFLTWCSDQHQSYWRCCSQMPTYVHLLWIVNGRIKEHNPEKLLLCSNTAGQWVIKLSTQCWRLPTKAE